MRVVSNVASLKIQRNQDAGTIPGQEWGAVCVQTCRYSWPCFSVYSKQSQGHGTMAHCENCIEQINHREFPPAVCLKQVGKPQVTMSDTAFSLLDSTASCLPKFLILRLLIFTSQLCLYTACFVQALWDPSIVKISHLLLGSEHRNWERRENMETVPTLSSHC